MSTTNGVTNTIKAIEVIRPGEIHIAAKPADHILQPEDVLVRMKAAGICGSDLHIYNGHSAFAVYPNIMGHELAGEIIAVGDHVKHLQVGDRVAINNVLSCGTCYACSIGRSNVCREVKVMGVHVPGGYREELKVSCKNVYRIPDNVPWEHAALVEPYSIVAQVLDRGRLTEGDHVLITGMGPLGLMTLQAVKRLNNVRVAVLDIVESRLNKAKQLGADLVLNGKTDDIQAELMAFTNDEGASLIIESTGSIVVLENCVRDFASQAGRIVVLGFPKETAKISPYDIMRRELEIIGSRLNNEQFPVALEWMAKGEVDASQIISHRFSFTDAQVAMDLINEKPHEVLKVMLQF